MKSDLEIIREALERCGYKTVADVIRILEEARDRQLSETEAYAINAITDNYGSGE